MIDQEKLDAMKAVIQKQKVLEPGLEGASLGETRIEKLLEAILLELRELKRGHLGLPLMHPETLDDI